jgi:methyl-accepting chemotaxis protein
VLSVAAATIAKDDTIKELTISIGKPARPGSNGASSPQHTKAQPVLDEKARKSRLEAAKANMESLAASATEAAQHAVSAAVQFGRNSYTAKNARQHADEVKEMADEARQEYEKMAKNANPE